MYANYYLHIRLIWIGFHTRNNSLIPESTQESGLLTSCISSLVIPVTSQSTEELAHLKRPWCWEGLRAGGEVDDRGWDGWMASPTQWTWVWVNSGSWWWTRRPYVLWFMGSQRVSHMTEWLNWTELNCNFPSLICLSSGLQHLFIHLVPLSTVRFLLLWESASQDWSDICSYFFSLHWSQFFYLQGHIE